MVPVDFHLTEGKDPSITRYTHSHIASLHAISESQSFQIVWIYSRNGTSPDRKRADIRQKEAHYLHIISAVIKGSILVLKCTSPHI